MFIPVKHKSLETYKAVRELTKDIYRISIKLPAEEKFNMVQQIRRAAVYVKLNLAEGSTRKSDLERKRYLEIARGSVVEIDAALETAVDLNYYSIEELQSTGELLNKMFCHVIKND